MSTSTPSVAVSMAVVLKKVQELSRYTEQSHANVRSAINDLHDITRRSVEEQPDAAVSGSVRIVPDMFPGVAGLVQHLEFCMRLCRARAAEELKASGEDPGGDSHIAITVRLLADADSFICGLADHVDTR